MEQALAEFLKTLPPQKTAELLAVLHAARVADAPGPSTSAQEPVRSQRPANTATDVSRAASMLSNIKEEEPGKEVTTMEALKRVLKKQETELEVAKLKNKIADVRRQIQLEERATAEILRKIEEEEERSKEHLRSSKPREPSPKPRVMDRMSSPSQPGPAPPSREYMGRTTDLQRPSRRQSRRPQVDQVPAPSQQPRHKEYRSYREPEPEDANQMLRETDVIFDPLRNEERPDRDAHEGSDEIAYNLVYFNEGEHHGPAVQGFGDMNDNQRAQLVQRTQKLLKADPQLVEMFLAETLRKPRQEEPQEIPAKKSRK